MHAHIDYYQLLAILLLNKGKLNQALEIAYRGNKLAIAHNDEVREICFLTIISKIELFFGNLTQAMNKLVDAEKIIATLGEKTIVPYWLIETMCVRSKYGLMLLEDTNIQNDDKPNYKKRKEILLVINKNVKFAKNRVFPVRVEALKYKGTYYWLIGNYKKALKYFSYSIAEGKNFDVKPELARTYFELSKRLLEGVSPFKKLNGIRAEQYLEMARTMIEEMDLQWDLDQLERLQMYFQ